MHDKVACAALVETCQDIDGTLSDGDDGHAGRVASCQECVGAEIVGPDPDRINRLLRVEPKGPIIGLVQVRRYLPSHDGRKGTVSEQIGTGCAGSCEPFLRMSPVSDANTPKRLTVEVERTVLGSPRWPLVPTVRGRVVRRVGVRVSKGDKVFDLSWCNTERDGRRDERQERRCDQVQASRRNHVLRMVGRVYAETDLLILFLWAG